VRLAARLLAAPMALVLAQRPDGCQVLGAAGTDGPLPQPLLDLAGCLCEERAATSSFVLCDIAASPRGDRSGIRACACVPLLERSGALIARLLVLDRRPRTWGADDLQALHDVCGGALAEMELERRRAPDVEVLRRLESLEQEHRATEFGFALAFRAHPLPMTIHDFPEGRYLDVNEAWLAHTGFTREEALGRTSAELGTYVDPSVRERLFRALQEHGQVRGIEGAMRMKNGEVRQFLLTSQRVTIGGQVRLLSGIQDITELKHVEARLRESEEQFRMIAELANEGVWLVDLQVRTQYVNARMAQLLGCAREELLGSSPLDFLFPEDIEAGREHISRALRGLNDQFDFRFRRNDGGELLVMASTSPQKDDQGRIVGAMAMLSDMTERRRALEALRASEAQLSLITHALPVFILHCDTQFRYRFVNAAYAARFGLQPAALVGRRVPEFLGPEVWEVVKDKLTRVLRGEFVQYEALIPYQGLGGRFMRSVNVPERDAEGNVRGLIGILIDITEQKRVEEERAQLLEQSLQQAQLLRLADRRKDEFLAMLAHELRNPLAPIANAAQLLPALVRDDARAREVVEIVQRQVKHMSRLVEDLLDVSRITLGKVTLREEEVDLVKVLDAGTELARPWIEDRGHQLQREQGDEPLLVRGDAARLAQVIGNLLNNAAKYTDRGGRIALTLQRDGDEGVVTVRDNGRGISPDLLPHVFELFTQAEPTLDRAQGGLGIGLALVRTLVTMHGGRVQADSAGPGKGSAFTVRLPLLPADSLRHPAGTPSLPPGRKRRVLVVDDNVDAADSIALLLRMQGHDVRVGYDGESALALACEHCPEILLLDIGLPRTDGYALARELRAQPQLARATFVAVTGYGLKQDRERARAAGFDHHLVKPVDFSLLLTLFEEA
jgi:PAS domain S-box-containing protein